MNAFEANIDSLVGLTHFYGGLAAGNLASLQHRYAVSHPKKAALEGLEKMLFLMREGLVQFVLPPHPRPCLPLLQKAGFEGDPTSVLKRAWKENPPIFLAAFSSSFMWTANAAIITPSSDSADKKVHITPANLSSLLHRSIEPPFTTKLLKLLFPEDNGFIHHPPLPSALADEGAANHIRFTSEKHASGLHLFVYGRSLSQKIQPQRRFYPRQTLEAQNSIARLHEISPENLVFAEQSLEAIEAGVFHNDVISTGYDKLFLYHEKTFSKQKDVLNELEKKGGPLELHEVREKEVSLQDAVSSYLFNSQIVRTQEGKKLFLAPEECRETTSVRSFLERWLPKVEAEGIFFSLKESMQNGGGPACLRLRAVLVEKEIAACHPGFLLSEALGKTLKKWIEKHYRDELHPNDLLDIELFKESQIALRELTDILQIPSIYEEIEWS